jgi:hypothetical protein
MSRTLSSYRLVLSEIRYRGQTVDYNGIGCRTDHSGQCFPTLFADLAQIYRLTIAFSFCPRDPTVSMSAIFSVGAEAGRTSGQDPMAEGAYLSIKIACWEGVPLIPFSHSIQLLSRYSVHPPIHPSSTSTPSSCIFTHDNDPYPQRSRWHVQ